MKRLHNIQPFDESGTLLERLFEVAVRLTGAMDVGLAERGLTRTRAEVLWHLQRQPSLTQRQLSQLLRCTPRNVTDLVDALEARGLVVRRPHPTDRRATLVRLTPDGEAEATRMQAGYERLAASLFADLSDAERAALAVGLDLVLARFRQEVSPSLSPGA